MFKILKFLLLFIVIIFAVTWLVNNNGEVVINWLGYEIVTDMFMVVAIGIVCLVFIFMFTYLLTKIFSFKISFFTERFTNKNNVRKLKKSQKDSEVAYEYLVKILAYLDEEEVKKAKKEYKKFAGLVKNNDIIEYLEFRFGYFESDSYDSKKSKQIANNVPGNSPANEKDGGQYFTFAKGKGWSK